MPTFGAKASARALEKSAKALYDSGNVVLPVDVELAMTEAAFTAMTEVPQASPGPWKK